MHPSHDVTLEIPLAFLTASQENIIGALFVGTFCALILYGISLNQLYRYLLRFTSDDRYVHAIGDRSESAMLIAPAPIILVTQMFFARRVWLIGPRYRLVMGVAVIVLLVQFGFAIAGVNIKAELNLLYPQHIQWRRGNLVRQEYPLLVNIHHSPVYANSLLSALNSRNLQKSPSIFHSGSYGRNLIQRMNYRTATETWNVPQIMDEPSVIHISVMTEDEGVKRDPPFK
ncbi:hypothetical protein V8D89_009865 [Ganoderma adspersum]